MHTCKTTHEGWGEGITHAPLASPENSGASAVQEHTHLLAGRPDLLPVEPDLCELTGLSAQTIRNLIKLGELPGCRIGRRLYVPKTRFIEFVIEGGGLNG